MRPSHITFAIKTVNIVQMTTITAIPQMTWNTGQRFYVESDIQVSLFNIARLHPYFTFPYKCSR